MKRFNLIFLMILAFSFSSCINEGVEESTLSLSVEDVIEFSKQASEMSINVMTNQTEWTAYANVDWISIEQENSTINLIVKENNLASERTASLLVIAGGSSKKVSIVQIGAEVKLTLYPESKTVEQWGEKFDIDVLTNSVSWSIDVPDNTKEWLKVEAKPYKNTISIEVLETKDRKPREATINVIDNISKQAKELVISQDGILYYALPLITPESKYADIIEFEEKNRSKRRLDKDFIDNNIIFFETKNPAFPSVRYHMGIDYIESVWVYVDNPDIFVEKEFYEMYTNDGFEKQPGTGPHTGADVWYAKDVTSKTGRPFRLSVEIAQADPSMGIAGIIFYIIYPLQPKNIQTFSELPLGFTDFDNGSKDQVRTWETQNGGIYNKNNSSAENEKGTSIESYTIANKYPYYMRNYVYKYGVLSRTWIFINAIEECFYEFDGKFYKTKEFNDLIKNSGYSYLGTDTNGFSNYVNGSTGLEMDLKASSYEGVYGGNPLLEIYLNKVRSQSSSKKSNLYSIDINKELKKGISILNKN